MNHTDRFMSYWYDVAQAIVIYLFRDWMDFVSLKTELWLMEHN